MTASPRPTWAVLIDKARGDAQALACLAADEALPIWGIGFHAQQAAEKALKAVLSRRLVKYPFTHDLEGLLELLSAAGIPLPPDAETLPRLTPFGTQMRYEELFAHAPVSLDRAWAIEVVRRTIHWAEDFLERE